jgi:hypothetical protein
MSSNSANVYYYVQSPYLQDYIKESINKRIHAIQSYQVQQLTHHQQEDKNNKKAYSSVKLIRAIRGDAQCEKLLDNHTGQIILSSTARRCFTPLPLFCCWTDGAKRTLPLIFMKTLALNQMKNQILTTFLGSSNGLSSKILDNKYLMQQLLLTHHRDYAPQCALFNITNSSWQTEINSLLAKKTFNSSHLIIKPAAGLKQRGILLVRNELESLSLIAAHCPAILRLNQHDRFDEWVIQSYCDDIMLLSGLDLTILKGEEEKLKQFSLQQTNESTLCIRLNQLYSNAATMTSGKKSAPQTKVSVNELPSDSGSRVAIHGLYKFHFRVFALIVYNNSTAAYTIYQCKTVKLYHAAKPAAIINTQHPQAEQYLTHNNSNCINDYKADCLIDCRDCLNFSQSITQSLALRLGNDILHPEFLSKFLSAVEPIVVDTIDLAVKNDSLLPHSWAENCFQVLGYDFLWNNATQQPILLEINNNVGQGIMKKDMMISQGQSNSRYEAMCDYWSKEYREKFIESLVQCVMDPVIHYQSQNPVHNMFQYIKSIASGNKKSAAIVQNSTIEANSAKQ